MIGMALLFQLLAVFCFLVYALQHKPRHDAESIPTPAPTIQAGQVYEQLIPAQVGQPTSIAYRKVIDVKDGFVKYSISKTPNDFSVSEFVDPEEIFLLYSRLLVPKANPFEETKQ